MPENAFVKGSYMKKLAILGYLFDTQEAKNWSLLLQNSNTDGPC